ncbi:hypothetical protein ACHQM5_008128 [Ranunculus cassubicifolius]
MSNNSEILPLKEIVSNCDDGKDYPKPSASTTLFDAEGYTSYRRPTVNAPAQGHRPMPQDSVKYLFEYIYRHQ